MQKDYTHIEGLVRSNLEEQSSYLRVKRLEGDYRWMALRESPRLIEHHHPHIGSALHRISSLHQDTVLGSNPSPHLHSVFESCGRVSWRFQGLMGCTLIFARVVQILTAVPHCYLL